MTPNAPSNATAVEHVTVRGHAAGFRQEVTAGKYHFTVDEPRSLGGTETAPDPYDYLLAALGACTSMTVGFYARRKKLPLENVTVSLAHSRIYAKDCEDCETKEGMLDRIDVDVQLTGALTSDQRATLTGHRGEMPSASHPHIRDRHPAARENLLSQTQRERSRRVDETTFHWHRVAPRGYGNFCRRGSP